MNRLVLSITLLLVAITLAGCYTQIGYYEPRHSTRQTSYHHQDKDKKGESEQQEHGGVEAKGEASEVEVEGYYGRRKPSYSYSDRYHRSYYYDDYYYPVYPYYYGGYHPLYPYYRYSYPYYGYYPYYGGYGYRSYRHRYSKPRSKIGDLNFGKRRSQSYRGVRSRHPSSSRPDRSLRKSEESKSPTRGSSESQRDRSRRSGRR
ncbi:hypothetical protein F4X33_13030 [Candidatus Poribacteria bacterium]|nr:hypothetical protein [Candidatus Poribacteria bacterium]